MDPAPSTALVEPATAEPSGEDRVVIAQPPVGLIAAVLPLVMMVPIGWPLGAWAFGWAPAWAVDHPAAYQTLLVMGVATSVVWFTGTRIELRAPAGTLLLPDESLWRNWRLNWWAAASFFAALPALATSLWHGVGGWWQGAAAQSAGENLLMAVALTAVLLAMVGGMRERQRAWVDRRGIQTSLLHRFDWPDLLLATEDGDGIALFHRERPTVPMGCLRIADERLRTRVLSALREHGVPIEPYPAGWDGARTGFLVLRAFTAVACWLIAVSMPGWWVWGLIAAFSAWIVLQLMTERLRGFHLVRKERTVVEPPPVTAPDDG